MGMVTMADLKPNTSGKRAFLPTSSARHVTAAWPISDVSSDITIEVGSASFALHKFPLVSRSGRIRKHMVEAKDGQAAARISFPFVPGGSEAFELAAKFCYGVNVEISLSNVAMLCCAAHFLEMTEDYADKNLERRTEVYLKDCVLPNISNCITVLDKCESLLPMSEDIHLVSRMITAIANNASKEQLSSGLSRLQHFSPKPLSNVIEPEMAADWWGKSLAILNLDFFQRVLSAVKLKGLQPGSITKILINYAHSHTSLQDPQKKQQRVIVEAMVSLLPTTQSSRKSSAAVPMAFLSSLLKGGITCSVSASCRAELERRIGVQLDEAILEDILIPSLSTSSSTGPMYDTESTMRIFSIFLNLDNEDDDDDDEDDSHLRDEESEMMMYDFDDSPKNNRQSSILKVSKLLDNYLAEVALDSNLTPSKFITLAELLPHHARVVTDGLYRAVDIFLKVHPNIKDSERYRLCKTIDCQKLSEEGCSHAAQNERLPVQMAVQVLYFEQIRLRNAMNRNGGSQTHLFFGSINNPQRSSSGVASGAVSPRDNYASVRRENRELKLEVARMRMRLTHLEKDHVSIKQDLVRSHPAHKLFNSFTKKLGNLSSLFRFTTAAATTTTSNKPLGSKPHSQSRFFFHRRRRHSVG